MRSDIDRPNWILITEFDDGSLTETDTGISRYEACPALKTDETETWTFPDLDEMVPIHATRKPADLAALLQDSLNAESHTFQLLELAEKQCRDIRAEFERMSKRHEVLAATCAAQGRKLAEIESVIGEGAMIFSQHLANELNTIRDILKRKGSNR